MRPRRPGEEREVVLDPSLVGAVHAVRGDDDGAWPLVGVDQGEDPACVGGGQVEDEQLARGREAADDLPTRGRAVIQDQ